MKRVLKTRNIGMKTDASGHPMAPMEIVYEAEKSKRNLWRYWPLGLALAGLALALLQFAFVDV